MRLRLLTGLLTALLFGFAPFQCASDPDPNRRLEDTPAEALWDLAMNFHEQGDIDACRHTLERLVERYPHSREAQRARQVLEEGAAPEATEPDEPTEASG